MQFSIIPTPSPNSRKPKLPRWLIGIFLLLVVASWLPLVLLIRGRYSTSTEPRVQIMQDMGTQPKYREQQSSEVFADGRADRPVIVGTVARGQLQEDDHYYRGFTQTLDSKTGNYEVTYFTSLPDRPETLLTDAFVKRGQDRFNIYCAACHGLDGSGNGSVSKRAIEREVPTWVPPTDLTGDVARGRADGHIFNTLTNGIRNMPGYGAQIPVDDRWAIIAYVRALQLSQHAKPTDVPTEKLQALK